MLDGLQAGLPADPQAEGGGWKGELRSRERDFFEWDNSKPATFLNGSADFLNDYHDRL
jgi:hypothetical protein